MLCGLSFNPLLCAGRKKRQAQSWKYNLNEFNYSLHENPHKNLFSFLFQDCHIKTHSSTGEPVVDTSQDYVLLSGSENATHTILRFRRKFNTCDDKSDVPITVRDCFIAPRACSWVTSHGCLGRKLSENINSRKRDWGHWDIETFSPTMIASLTHRYNLLSILCFITLKSDHEWRVENFLKGWRSGKDSSHHIVQRYLSVVTHEPVPTISFMSQTKGINACASNKKSHKTDKMAGTSY